MLQPVSEFPFLRLNNIPLCAIPFLILLIYMSINEHLNGLYILAIVNNAAVNMDIRISF